MSLSSGSGWLLLHGHIRSVKQLGHESELQRSSQGGGERNIGMDGWKGGTVEMDVPM